MARCAAYRSLAAVGWRWRVTDDQFVAIHEMPAAGQPITQIARATTLSRPTVYRVLRELDPPEAA